MNARYGASSRTHRSVRALHFGAVELGFECGVHDGERNFDQPRPAAE